VAVTERAWLVVTVHAVAGPPPAQVAPLQASKRQPLAGVAVRVTEMPASYDALVEPAALRVIPAGLELTDPEPTWVAVSVHDGWKVAVTNQIWFMVTVHVVTTPEHVPPLQPVKTDPLIAVAVRVIEVPVS
jgi:hypothetical protein